MSENTRVVTGSSFIMKDGMVLIKSHYLNMGTAMKFQYNNGGRTAAGFKGETGDCVTRAIAIATGIPYLDVYNALNELAKMERPRKGKRSNSRTGVKRTTYERYLLELGWTWVPTMQVGSGCKVHLRTDELPNARIIAAVSRHMVAVINGVIHDTVNPSREGTRCVYGYYIEPYGYYGHEKLDPTVTP